MRVIVDRDLCEGQGFCEQLAPEVFQLDDAGVLHLRVEQLPDATVDLMALYFLK